MTAAWNYIKMKRRLVVWPAHSAVKTGSQCFDLKMWMVQLSEALNEEKGHFLRYQKNCHYWKSSVEKIQCMTGTFPQKSQSLFLVYVCFPKKSNKKKHKMIFYHPQFLTKLSQSKISISYSFLKPLHTVKRDITNGNNCTLGLQESLINLSGTRKLEINTATVSKCFPLIFFNHL